MAMRAVAGAALALVIAAVGAGRAEAGTYAVHACQTPGGAVTRADGWSAAVGGAYLYASIACPGGSIAASADPATAHPRGSTLTLTFTAPPNTRVSAFDVRRTVHVSRGPDWAWNYTTFVGEANVNCGM